MKRSPHNPVRRAVLSRNLRRRAFLKALRMRKQARQAVFFHLLDAES